MAAELALSNTKLEKPTIEQIKSNKNGKYKKFLTNIGLTFVLNYISTLYFF